MKNKKTPKLKLDEKTAEILNRVCNERYRLYNIYTDDPCMTNYLRLKDAIEFEEDIFEIAGVDLADFIFSEYRKY